MKRRVQYLFLLIFLCIGPSMVHALDVNAIIGAGGFIQGSDPLTYEKVSDSSRYLSVQITNRIIEHISLGADITLIDSYTKYKVAGEDLIANDSFIDFMALNILTSFDFMNNVFFIQIGLGMMIETKGRERIMVGGVGVLGINIPVSDFLFVPILARIDMYLGDEFRYPLSFGIGITYRLE